MRKGRQNARPVPLILFNSTDCRNRYDPEIISDKIGTGNLQFVAFQDLSRNIDNLHQ